MSYEKIKPVEYTEAELRELWRCEYCRKVIHTHDGIRVRFYKDQFDHAFYESTNRKKANKDGLSYARLEKMLWIKDVLVDASAKMYVGWDKKTKSYNTNKRVSIVKGDYVVVIGIIKDTEAKFITAYNADSPHTKAQIIKSPEWKK